MKKILLIFLFLFTFNLNVFANSAESFIVMDQDTGRVLYENNIHNKKLIASTTKIMTAIVTIENAKLNKKVTIGKEVLRAYGSNIYIEMGEKLTIEELLYGLMLRSGNDAALALAKNVAGNTSNFVKLMNKKAEEIGMKNTIFYNPHGLEDNKGVGNLSTAYDMALLTRYAMQNKYYKEIVKTKSKTVKTNYKTYVWNNKNKLLKTYEYTTGGKTGFTKKARRTLVTTATKDNKNLIIVSLNDPNDFKDHKDYYESYFNKYNFETILDKHNFEIKNKKDYEKEKLYIKNSFNMLLKKDEIKNVDMEIVLNDKKIFGKTSVVGKVNVFYKNDLIHTENIYLKKSQKENNKSIWDKFKFWD